MREYKCTDLFGQTVDLDNPETYKHLPTDLKVLDKLMFELIGKAIVYMDYFPSRKGMYPKRKLKDKFAPLTEWYPDADPEAMVEVNNTGWYQRKRIEELIQNFASERKNNYDNVMWLQEQVFLFQDETENMC